MNRDFAALLDGIREGLVTSAGLFGPELVICATIVLLLVVRLFNADRWFPAYGLALTGTAVAFCWSLMQSVALWSHGMEPQPFFTGLLMFDQFTAFFRVFLLLFLVFVITLAVLSGIPDDEDGPDFFTLLLGSTLGAMLMASANHLLIFFLAVEMTSVPSYVMVGFLKGRRQSSEAALKYVVYGAGAAGVMLYGISLLAGLLGTAEMPEIAARLNLLLTTEAAATGGTVKVIIVATLMILVGLAFKLSIFPFHFWCPDAFEGALAEVAGYLSVASKAGAFALTIRFCLAFTSGPGTSEVLSDVQLLFGLGIGVVAALTATFGNLAAYTQSNMKRMLAYSTIAHAGYMLMAVSALMVIRSGGSIAGLNVAAESARAVQGLLYYLAIYLFMNLGAFAIVALIRNYTFSEEVDSYAGLAREVPLLCIGMGVCLFSLVGLPPFGGFFGKFYVFAAVVSAAKVHWLMWVIFAVGGLNTVFSLFYYLRVLKAMFLLERPADARRVELPAASAAYVLLVAVPVLLLGVFAGFLSDRTQSVAAIFFS